MEINHYVGSGLSYDQDKCETCLKKLLSDKGCRIDTLNIIQVTDEELLEINRKHLEHDYYTDIITFRSGDGERIEQGELYISYERARENNKFAPENELLRLIIHGTLHLAGMDDSTPDEKERMRIEEDRYIEFHVELD